MYAFVTAVSRGVRGTAWSEQMDLLVPLLNAPMGGVAGGKLAGAVTAAGGLGMIGMGSRGTVEALVRELDHVRPASRRFGIGLIDWVIRKDRYLLEAAIEARPTLLSVSFGEQFEWIDAAHNAGILTATQIYNPVEAQRARDAGIDVLVARGAEGGGHGAPDIGVLPLLDAVLRTVSIPVLAAGGIGSARSVAAVLAAGASGVWVGTALAACTESLANDRTRAVMIAARATDTVVTTAYDAALGLPWPARFPARVLRTDLDERAARSGASEVVPVDAGQGIELVTAVQSVRDVVSGLFPYPPR